MTESQPITSASVGSAEGAGDDTFAVAKVFTSLPPDHPFFSKIGRVVAEAALIEHNLDLIIWELSSVTRELGSSITGQLAGARARFNALKSLAASKGLPKHIIDQLERLSNKANDVHERRNRFVHDAWYTAGNANVGQFKSFSVKDGKFGIHEITQKYVDETIDLIKETTFAVGTLRNDIQKQLQSSS